MHLPIPDTTLTTTTLHVHVLLEDDDDIVWVCYLTSSFRLVEPIEFIPHPGGLGLGATPKPPEPKKNRVKKPGEIERKVCTCIFI